MNSTIHYEINGEDTPLGTYTWLGFRFFMIPYCESLALYNYFILEDHWFLGLGSIFFFFLGLVVFFVQYCIHKEIENPTFLSQRYEYPNVFVVYMSARTFFIFYYWYTFKRGKCKKKKGKVLQIVSWYNFITSLIILIFILFGYPLLTYIFTTDSAKNLFISWFSGIALSYTYCFITTILSHVHYNVPDKIPIWGTKNTF